jgi:hypothetical protein
MMKSETKNVNNSKNHFTVAVSEKALSEKEPEKPGFLKRVLDWVGGYFAGTGEFFNIGLNAEE